MALLTSSLSFLNWVRDFGCVSDNGPSRATSDTVQQRPFVRAVPTHYKNHIRELGHPSDEKEEAQKGPKFTQDHKPVKHTVRI